MSRTTLIEYKGKQFRIHQVHIELLSQYICETFESIGLNTFNNQLKEIYDDCDGNRSGDDYGMANILFDEYIINTTDRDTLVNVFNQTKTRIQNLGSEISITQLNIFENNKNDENLRGEWHFPVKTQSLISFINLIIELLNEEEFPLNNKNIVFVGWPGTQRDTYI